MVLYLFWEITVVSPFPLLSPLVVTAKGLEEAGLPGDIDNNNKTKCIVKLHIIYSYKKETSK